MAAAPDSCYRNVTGAAMTKRTSEDGSFVIPVAFWQTVTHDEFMAIIPTSSLNAMQCLRLWKMLGRTDPCPTSIEIAVSLDRIDSA